MHPIELVSSAPWTRVVLTTYSLSLSFFEAVFLDALLRGGGRSAAILADPEGVRASLSEEGARRVGRDYEVFPVVRGNGGVFHPKVGVFVSSQDTVLTVGSGNLTFSGWGGNLEMIEYLHPSFAADAVLDAANFFRALAGGQYVTTTAGQLCEDIADGLSASTRGHMATGRTRLLHSFDLSIADYLELYANDLGGATRVTAISPFYDLNADGLNKLRRRLGCDEIFLHNHPYAAPWGRPSNAWPFDSETSWPAVVVGGDVEQNARPLHAKSLEVLCRNGRLLLTGSANVTEAGLFGTNVEASVLRIESDRTGAWSLRTTTAPERNAASEQTADSKDLTTGILAANLEGNSISGQLLTHMMIGEFAVKVRVLGIENQLGNTVVDAEGQFRIPVTETLGEDWLGGRTVLRLEGDSQVWEGFLSIAATLELARRAGAVAARLISMMIGNEAPEDVVAVLAWFAEDPSRLPQSQQKMRPLPVRGKIENGVLVSHQDLVLSVAQETAKHHLERSGAEDAMHQAMQLLRRAFAQPRGPLEAFLSEDDNEDNALGDAHNEQTRQVNQTVHDREKQRAFQNYEALLDVMLNQSWKGRHAALALSMAQYMVDRFSGEGGSLDPVRIVSWIRRSLHEVVSLDVPEADMIVASALLANSVSASKDRALEARRFFVRLGVDPTTVQVLPDTISAFVSVLAPGADLSAFLADVCAARTGGEEIEAFLAACRGEGPTEGFERMKSWPGWPRLNRALVNADALSRLIVQEKYREDCPRCNIVLPKVRQSDLRFFGLAETSCCGRIILNKDC